VEGKAARRVKKETVGHEGALDKIATPDMSGETSTELCKQPRGAVAPVIDRTPCEGKAECVAACPYDVFEVRVLTHDERSAFCCSLG
jgi:hypothetical protein